MSSLYSATSFFTISLAKEMETRFSCLFFLFFSCPFFATVLFGSSRSCWCNNSHAQVMLRKGFHMIGFFFLSLFYAVLFVFYYFFSKPISDSTKLDYLIYHAFYFVNAFVLFAFCLLVPCCYLNHYYYSTIHYFLLFDFLLYFFRHLSVPFPGPLLQRSQGGESPS